MARYLSWLANAVLLLICCFFVANTANALIAAWLAPAPELLAPAEAQPPASARPWSERELILQRNLFKAEAPPPPPAPKPTPQPVEEELEQTKLPLELIGTVASPNPELSWAAVLDKQARRNLVLQVQDEVQGKAVVERIERKRIVLRENGKLRELALSEEPAAGASSTRVSRRAGGPTRQTPAQRRAERRARRRPQAAPPPGMRPIPGAQATPSPQAEAAPEASAQGELGMEEALLNLGDLLSQGEPLVEDGETVGFRVGPVEEGSLADQLGLAEGDVITEVNGMRVTSFEEGAAALAQGGDTWTLTREGPNGNETLRIPRLVE